MRFPLEVPPFPSVALSDRDAEKIVDLADLYVHETLEHYEMHSKVHHGVVDKEQWKFIKRRENMAVYQDRVARESTLSASVAAAVPAYVLDVGPPKKIQVIMACGTIEGDLDDLMYGVVNPTRENMMLKTSYIHDNVVDCLVLSTIVANSPQDPMRSVLLKWSVNGCPPLVRPVIRSRDFVYLESTGYARSSDGERIGYHIIHSVEIPGVRHLQEFRLVRGNLSIYHIFKQKSPGVVEVYLRGFCDTMGDMHPIVATYSCADAMIAIWRCVVCSQMKKLTWLLRTNQPAHTTAMDAAKPVNKRGCCAVCSNRNGSVFGASSPKKCCRICLGDVCGRCSVAKKLSFLSPVTREVITKRMSFCTRCVRAAVDMNGFSVAVDELARENRYEMYEVGTIRSSNESTRSFFWMEYNAL